MALGNLGAWIALALAAALAGCGSDSTDAGSGAPDSGGGAGGSGGTAAGGSAGSSGGGAGGSAASGGSAGSSASAGTSADAGPPKPLVGVYCGNEPSAVVAFETWLGKPVDGILGYTGGASWADFDGSVGWATNLWDGSDRRVFWSVPLIPEGATLEAAANGDYNDHYLQAAQTLSQFRPQDPELHVRTGWELNGDWFPWAAQGKEQAFIGAFREFVTTFRSVSNRFVFEWNVNIGNQSPAQMNPEDAYPGDDVVDIVGMDFYWNTQWDPTDPNEAWASMRDRTYGLQWHQDFAAAHGKKTAYSEWGVMSDAAGPYIASAQKWFEDHGVVFHTYWNSNSDFKGKLSDGQYPAAGAAFQQAFGP